MRKIVLIYSILSVTYAVWTSQNFPNPMRVDSQGYAACRMQEPSLLCDPDATLTDQQRKMLNHQLMQFRLATTEPNADTECKRRGTTATIAIMDNISPNLLNQHNMSKLAVDVHDNWKPDPECHKSFVIVLPTKNWQLISRDFHYEAPIFYDEFTFYFYREQDAFERKDFFMALTNIIAGLQNAANLKRQLVENKFIDALNHYNTIMEYSGSRNRLIGAGFFPHQANMGFIMNTIAFFGYTEFVCAVCIISFIVCMIFECLQNLPKLLKWTKSKDYHPVKNEKNNCISQTPPPLPTTSSHHTSPTSCRSSKNITMMFANHNTDKIGDNKAVTIKYITAADSIVKCNNNANNNGEVNNYRTSMSTFTPEPSQQSQPPATPFQDYSNSYAYHSMKMAGGTTETSTNDNVEMQV